MKHTFKHHVVHFLLYLVLSVLSLTLTAQTGKTIRKAYLQSGGGVGFHDSELGEIGLQTIFNNKWCATVSYQDITMTPKNLPSDYQAESGYVFFIPYSSGVDINMNLFSVTAGKYFHLDKNIWATIEAGLSYINGEKASFQPTAVTSSSLIIFASTTSNYITTKEKKSTVGAMLRADINWAFSSFMGIGTGVYANFNSIQSPVGFQVKFIVGYTGREKNKK